MDQGYHPLLDVDTDGEEWSATDSFGGASPAAAAHNAMCTVPLLPASSAVERMSAVAAWIRNAGGFVNSSVSVVVAGEHGDRTLRVGACAAGTEVMTIPLKCVVTPFAAARATAAGRAVAADARCCKSLVYLGANVPATVQFALLILGALEEPASRWYHFVRSLPPLTSADSALLLWSRRAAARRIGEVELRRTALREREAIDDAYDACCAAYPPLAVASSSLDFARAVVLATSRSFALDEIPAPPLGEEISRGANSTFGAAAGAAAGGARAASFATVSVPALVPLADLMNHSPAQRNAAWHFDARRRCFTVTTTRRTAAREQLRCSYGRKPAAELLTSYGFVLSPSDIDEYEGSPDELRVELPLTSIARAQLAPEGEREDDATAALRDVLWERTLQRAAIAPRAPPFDEGDRYGEFILMHLYRSISYKSCSQFDSLPLIYFTVRRARSSARRDTRQIGRTRCSQRL